MFLKTLETITACFLSHAVHTNAVGLHMSALQPRIADRVAARNLFAEVRLLIFSSLLHKRHGFEY